jgi:hypothetical protein
MKGEKITWPRFDHMITSVRIQHVTTELTRFVAFRYLFTEQEKNQEHMIPTVSKKLPRYSKCRRWGEEV